MKSTLPNSKPKNEKGAALLTVLVSITLIMLMLFEFQYRTMVEQKLAYNDLDRIRAYYLAKAAANIGVLRVSLYGKALASQSGNNSKFNVQQYLDKIWSLPLPPFPPTEAEISQLDAGKDKNAATEALEQTKIADGRYFSTIQSESSKINLNHLIIPKNLEDKTIDFTRDPQGLHEHVGRLLINLLENFIRDSDDSYEEYGNMKPDEIVLNIIDWINPGDDSAGGGFKDGWYERQTPPYKAKRNRFYTVDELRLVKGIDEKLLQKLKPHVTVNSYAGKININTARKSVFKALYPEFTPDDLEDLLKHRGEIQGFSSASQFVTYVADTLNRPGFKEYYPTEADYPFTVANESFLVEATGQVSKSASTIQSRIQVAVALVTQSRGGTVASNITKANCNGNYVFLKRDGRCYHMPTSEDECILMTGEWTTQGEKKCCDIYKPKQLICPADPQPGETKKEAPPNALRVVSWMES